MPAPPPESLPAIVRADRISIESFVMNANAATGSLLSRTLSHSDVRVSGRAIAVLLAVALTALSAQFTLPFPGTAVPLVLTPLAVMLTGAVLGSRLGFLTQALYLAAGIAGLPVFAPSVTLPPGALRLIGPTAGYLLAYPVAAFVTGWLAERGWDRRYLTSLAEPAGRTGCDFCRWRVLALAAPGSDARLSDRDGIPAVRTGRSGEGRSRRQDSAGRVEVRWTTGTLRI